MTTFSMTLDAADFPRASELFARLAHAFQMFAGEEPSTSAAPVAMAASAPVAFAAPPAVQSVPSVAPAQPQSEAPAADEPPATEAPKRKRRTKEEMAADEAAKLAAPAVAKEAPAAPANDADAMTDDDLLNALRAAGNALIQSRGAEPVVAALGKRNVKKYGDLPRAGRLELLAELRALAA